MNKNNNDNFYMNNFEEIPRFTSLIVIHEVVVEEGKEGIEKDSFICLNGLNLIPVVIKSNQISFSGFR